MKRRFFLQGAGALGALFASGCLGVRTTQIDPGDSSDQLGSVILDQSSDLEIIHVYHDHTQGLAGSWLEGATGSFLQSSGDNGELMPSYYDKIVIEFPNLEFDPNDFGVNVLEMPAFLAGGTVRINHGVSYQEDQNPNHRMWLKKHGIWQKAA